MPSAVRTRTNDPAGLRRRVISVAAEAFQSTGYRGTSMQDILREASVSGGALYHHFPTKKDLGLAVITEHVGEEVTAVWKDPVRTAPSAAEGILAAFDGVIAHLEAAGAVRGCPLNNLALELSLADPAFRDAIKAEYADWRRVIADRIRADTDQGGGGYAQGDPEAFADVVVSMYSGAIAMAKAEQSPGALRSCRAQLHRLMRAI